MKILVTGASGFIGSALVKALSEQGHQVFALMRGTSSSKNLEGLKYERLTGDLFNSASLVAACSNAEVIFHLAGLITAPNRKEYFRYNAEGTRNLALAAIESGTPKKLIHVSSLAASGPSCSLNPKLETDPDAPVSSYGESKLRAELYLDELKDKLPFISFRPPMVYGPHDQAVFFIIKTVARQWMPLLPSKTATGHKYYSSIHVDDLVQALTKSLEAPSSIFEKGERFFISDGQIYTYERILSMMAKELNVKPITFKIPEVAVRLLAQVGSVATDYLNLNTPLNRDKLNELIPDYWICSTEKAKELLKYSPKYNMETGLAHTIAWYKLNGWL